MLYNLTHALAVDRRMHTLRKGNKAPKIQGLNEVLRVFLFTVFNGLENFWTASGDLPIFGGEKLFGELSITRSHSGNSRANFYVRKYTKQET